MALNLASMSNPQQLVYRPNVAMNWVFALLVLWFNCLAKYKRSSSSILFFCEFSLRDDAFISSKLWVHVFVACPVSQRAYTCCTSTPTFILYEWDPHSSKEPCLAFHWWSKASKQCAVSSSIASTGTSDSGKGFQDYNRWNTTHWSNTYRLNRACHSLKLMPLSLEPAQPYLILESSPTVRIDIGNAYTDSLTSCHLYGFSEGL